MTQADDGAERRRPRNRVADEHAGIARMEIFAQRGRNLGVRIGSRLRTAREVAAGQAAPVELPRRTRDMLDVGANDQFVPDHAGRQLALEDQIGRLAVMHAVPRR